MLNFRRISFVQRSISFGLNARRFLSSHRSSQPSFIDEKYLIRQHSWTTSRAENLFSKIPKDDIILSINEDEDDLPHPPIVAQ
jgi:hypothetical protein